MKIIYLYYGLDGINCFDYDEIALKYKISVDEVVDLIDKYRDSLSGKKKKYAKQLRDYVGNRDSSFEFNLKRALKDCEDISMVSSFV